MACSPVRILFSIVHSRIGHDILIGKGVSISHEGLVHGCGITLLPIEV